ncbi:MAG TPA: hypothetical protein VEA69_19120 [Tepidisphaeraceae bacterium]|nr:hypothetical protein [Tepidisphaeraceae bacterium]
MTRRAHEWKEAFSYLWKAPLWLACVVAVLGVAFVALPASMAMLSVPRRH